jgi:hypothetical protein
VHTVTGSPLAVPRPCGEVSPDVIAGLSSREIKKDRKLRSLKDQILLILVNLLKKEVLAVAKNK